MNLLVLLVGGNPIANYALIEYFKNNGDERIPKYDSIMLIYTSQTEKVTQNIESLKDDVSFININLESNESNLRYIKKIVLNKLNSLENINSIHLNYTGGRKPMSLGAFLTINEFTRSCKKIYTDINPNNYKLTLEDGNTYLKGDETISSKLNIPIIDFYQLHGLTKPEYKTKISDFYSEEFCMFLLDKCENSEKEFYVDLWDQKNIRNLDWKKSLPEYIDKKISNNQLKSLQKFIKGIWLEEYLFSILNEIKEECNITDIAYNVEAENRNKKFEVDVIAISGYKSFVFSCTTGYKARDIKQKAFEVDKKAEQLAGRGSNSIVVCLAKDIEKNDSGITGLKSDMKHIEKSFNAIGIEDIKDKKIFKTKLKEIF